MFITISLRYIRINNQVNTIVSYTFLDSIKYALDRTEGNELILQNVIRLLKLDLAPTNTTTQALVRRKYRDTLKLATYRNTDLVVFIDQQQ